MGELLDAALDRAFADRSEPIRFVQIGGNDGVYMDPLHQHRLTGAFDFEWGHIFEPIPEYFDLLSENMRPFPYVTCHQLAVDDLAEAGTRQFNFVSPADVEKHRLPQSSQGLGSFSRDRNALGGIGYNDVKFRAIEGYIQTIEVATVPIIDVVRRYEDANLFVTDCEGHDIEIISVAFEQAEFRPRIIQFEHLGTVDERYRQTLDRAQSLGYKITRSGRDVICERI